MKVIDDSKKVSIVTLLYNSERFLKGCIDSVLAQSYENLEIICVVNGESDDNTESIVRSYAQKDLRVKVVKNHKNNIIGEGLRIGLNEVAGDYFTMLDGDDKLYKNAIYDLVSVFQETDCDIVIGNVMRMTEGEELLGVVQRPDFEVRNRDEYYVEAIPYIDVLWHGKLYKSFLYREDEFVILPVFGGIDMLMHYQLVSNAKNIARCDKNVHYYRNNSRSITKKLLYKHHEDSFKCFLFIDELFEDRGIYAENKDIYLSYKAYGLLTMARCLLTGRNEFVKKYSDDFYGLLRAEVFGEASVLRFLKQWKKYYYVLKIYHKNISLGTFACTLLDGFRVSYVRRFALYLLDGVSRGVRKINPVKE